jgi:hypothetical protein
MFPSAQTACSLTSMLGDLRRATKSLTAPAWITTWVWSLDPEAMLVSAQAAEVKFVICRAIGRFSFLYFCIPMRPITCTSPIANYHITPLLPTSKNLPSNCSISFPLLRNSTNLGTTPHAITWAIGGLRSFERIFLNLPVASSCCWTSRDMTPELVLI